MPSAQIKLVCFDLGGVLIRICQGWEEACGLVGLAAPRGVGDAAVLAKLREASDWHELGRCEGEEFAARAAGIMGLTPAQVTSIATAWLRGPYPGVPEMIERVKQTGIRTACLSNTNRLHWAAMTDERGPNRLPLDRLDHHFTSFACGHMKPGPGIYHFVEQQTGLQPPEILFFDDSLPNVQGARDCGWHCEQIDPTDSPPAQVLAHLRRYGVL